MATQCTPTQLPYHPFGRREVVACFADGRQSGRVEHGVEELVAQRVHGLALRPAAPVEHRRGRGQRSGVEADRRADPATLPGGANRGAGRLGLLPRRDHGLVRTQRRGLRLGAGAQRAPGQAHRQGAAQVPVPSRGHGPGIAAVSGLPLPHARFLEPNAPRGGQGGMVEQGGQPTLRGHQPVPRGGRRPISIREVVLRARGHGKQNQGMPVGSVRRPHRHGDATRQPTAAALRLPRLINRIAHYALSAAAVEQARTVDAEHLARAVEDLRP